MTPKQLSLFSDDSDKVEKFFNRKRIWSAAKHRILLRYIQAHCYNLGGEKKYQSPYINYVDGFAGTGKYNEGIGIEDFLNNSKFWLSQFQKYKHNIEDTDGSPLIALKCAKIFSEEKRVNLRCFFVEQSKKANHQLQQNCQAFSEDLTYKIYEPQPFSDALSEILADLQQDNYPTLFFLDTFAVKGLTFEHICKIGNYISHSKGELFFLFHNRQIARNAGQSTITSSEHRIQKAATTYNQHLTALLGLDSENLWKRKWHELKNQPQEFEKWALEYFKERIRKQTQFKGVTSFEIKEMYNDSRPQYSIIVCSNHPEKAFAAFLNEFVWDEERLLFFQEDKTKQFSRPLEKAWDNENTRRIVEIESKMIELLKAINQDNEWISLDKAVTRIILEIPELGFLKRSHYRDILIKLWKNGILDLRKPGKKKPYTWNSEIKFLE